VPTSPLLRGLLLSQHVIVAVVVPLLDAAQAMRLDTISCLGENSVKPERQPLRRVSAV
jgi:hypothetical protein